MSNAERLATRRERDRVRRAGLTPKQKARERAYHRNWKRGHPEVARAYKVKNADRIKAQLVMKKFGLTAEQFNVLLAKQGGVCAICKRPPPERRQQRLCVDHDHRTGLVRGLLCGGCNKGLGHLKDDPEIIRSALKYLTDHNG